eukprot:866098-Amphidinium_carterae.1
MGIIYYGMGLSGVLTTGMASLNDAEEDGRFNSFVTKRAISQGDIASQCAGCSCSHKRLKQGRQLMLLLVFSKLRLLLGEELTIDYRELGKGFYEKVAGPSD